MGSAWRLLGQGSARELRASRSGTRRTAYGDEGLVRRGCGGWLAGENESGRIFGSGGDPEVGDDQVECGGG